MPKFRRMTPQEEDRSGFSQPEHCHLCKGRGHFCGGCGTDLEHEQGSTCQYCWRLVYWEYWEGRSGWDGSAMD